VDDSSTALLMTRFYENLLRDGSATPMTKAEALAEAKRWLRELGPEEVTELTKDLPTRGARGRVVKRQQSGSVHASRTYEHPPGRSSLDGALSTPKAHTDGYERMREKKKVSPHFSEP
jgi:CHAT domain-containing protein